MSRTYRIYNRRRRGYMIRKMCLCLHPYKQSYCHKCNMDKAWCIPKSRYALKGQKKQDNMEIKHILEEEHIN